MARAEQSAAARAEARRGQRGMRISGICRARIGRRGAKLFPTLTGRRRPEGGANAIEAQRRRWKAEIPAKDAAIADRDIAYGEYLDYLQNAWKRPCGVVAGGRR